MNLKSVNFWKGVVGCTLTWPEHAGMSFSFRLWPRHTILRSINISNAKIVALRQGLNIYMYIYLYIICSIHNQMLNYSHVGTLNEHNTTKRKQPKITVHRTRPCWMAGFPEHKTKGLLCWTAGFPQNKVGAYRLGSLRCLFEVNISCLYTVVGRCYGNALGNPG